MQVAQHQFPLLQVHGLSGDFLRGFTQSASQAVSQQQLIDLQRPAGWRHPRGAGEVELTGRAVEFGPDGEDTLSTHLQQPLDYLRRFQVWVVLGDQRYDGLSGQAVQNEGAIVRLSNDLRVLAGDVVNQRWLTVDAMVLEGIDGNVRLERTALTGDVLLHQTIDGRHDHVAGGVDHGVNGVAQATDLIVDGLGIGTNDHFVGISNLIFGFHGHAHAEREQVWTHWVLQGLSDFSSRGKRRLEGDHAAALCQRSRYRRDATNGSSDGHLGTP
ncbi:hypothetical protein D3C87_1287750 [compost metagenome]